MVKIKFYLLWKNFEDLIFLSLFDKLDMIEVLKELNGEWLGVRNMTGMFGVGIGY